MNQKQLDIPTIQRILDLLGDVKKKFDPNRSLYNDYKIIPSTIFLLKNYYARFGFDNKDLLVFIISAYHLSGKIHERTFLLSDLIRFLTEIYNSDRKRVISDICGDVLDQNDFNENIQQMVGATELKLLSASEFKFNRNGIYSVAVTYINRILKWFLEDFENNKESERMQKDLLDMIRKILAIIILKADVYEYNDRFLAAAVVQLAFEQFSVSLDELVRIKENQWFDIIGKDLTGNNDINVHNEFDDIYDQIKDFVEEWEGKNKALKSDKVFPATTFKKIPIEPDSLADEPDCPPPPTTMFDYVYQNKDYPFVYYTDHLPLVDPFEFPDSDESRRGKQGESNQQFPSVLPIVKKCYSLESLRHQKLGDYRILSKEERSKVEPSTPENSKTSEKSTPIPHSLSATSFGRSGDKNYPTSRPGRSYDRQDRSPRRYVDPPSQRGYDNREQYRYERSRYVYPHEDYGDRYDYPPPDSYRYRSDYPPDNYKFKSDSRYDGYHSQDVNQRRYQSGRESYEPSRRDFPPSQGYHILRDRRYDDSLRHRGRYVGQYEDSRLSTKRSATPDPNGRQRK